MRLEACRALLGPLLCCHALFEGGYHGGRGGGYYAPGPDYYVAPEPFLLYRPSPNYVKRRELSEAIAWVNTRGDHDLFSFDSICEVFEIEPETLRRQLNSMSARSEDPPHAESNNLAIPSPRTVQRAPVEDLCGVVSRRPVNVAAHDSTTVHAPFSCYLLEVE